MGGEPVAQAPTPSGLAATPPQEVQVRELTEERGKVSGDYWTQRWKIESQFGTVPKKAHINDNIKVARRLLMEGRA